MRKGSKPTIKTNSRSTGKSATKTAQLKNLSIKTKKTKRIYLNIMQTNFCQISSHKRIKTNKINTRRIKHRSEI